MIIIISIVQRADGVTVIFAAIVNVIHDTISDNDKYHACGY